jgi:hypothetical protein
VGRGVLLYSRRLAQAWGGHPGAPGLKEAVQEARRRGARALEGYPVRPSKGQGADIPAAFAWTGVPSLFEKHKFADVTPQGQRRQIYRRLFRSSPKR